jgi:hypothetical protein
MTVSVSSSAQEQQFLQAFQQALESQSFDRMILSQYQGELEQLEKMTFRVVMLQGQPVLSCLYRHKTQDVTKNYSLDTALDTVTASHRFLLLAARTTHAICLIHSLTKEAHG